MKKKIGANNIITFIVEDNDKIPSLKEAYKLIDTDILQVVNLNNGDCFLVCEEGKLRNRPINRYATEMWEKSFSSDNNELQFYDVMVGHAIYIPEHLRGEHW